ncbi:hypothetical protein ACYSNR_01005 [Enterococcus sp. LJL128]
MKRTALAKMNGYVLYEDQESYFIEYEGTEEKFYYFISFRLTPYNWKTKTSEKGVIEIASKSFGMHNEEEMKKLIETYEQAIEAAKYFKTVIADNTDIEF